MSIDMEKVNPSVTEKEKAIIQKIIKENDKELDKLEEGL